MSDDVDIETGRHLLDWTPGPENPLDAKLSESPCGGYVLQISDAGTYLIDPGKGRIVMPVMPDAPLREARLLGLPLLLCFLARGRASLHGAAVMGPTGAIVLAAPGRHGKSSLAATLSRLGHRLLTEDLCCIQTSDQPALFPGPASLRVRHDMADHLLPIDGMDEIGMIDDRVVLAAKDPGDAAPVPIAAVVLLRGFNAAGSLREVNRVGALADLWLLSFHLPNASDRARKFDHLVDLVASVPIWELTQPDDPGGVLRTAEALVDSIAR